MHQDGIGTGWKNVAKLKKRMIMPRLTKWGVELELRNFSIAHKILSVKPLPMLL